MQRARCVVLLRAGITSSLVACACAALPLQRERAQTYLDFATLRPLLVLIDSKLISAHAAEAVERAFAPLVQQARLDDLRRMFALLSRVNRWAPPPPALLGVSAVVHARPPPPAQRRGRAACLC